MKKGIFNPFNFHIIAYNLRALNVNGSKHTFPFLSLHSPSGSIISLILHYVFCIIF